MKIRVFPAHPDHDNFYVPRKCYWLPFTTDSGDERRGTVLDSIFHGKTAMDIVQEYVAYVKTHGRKPRCGCELPSVMACCRRCRGCATPPKSAKTAWSPNCGSSRRASATP